MVKQKLATATGQLMLAFKAMARDLERFSDSQQGLFVVFVCPRYPSVRLGAFSEAYHPGRIRVIEEL